MLDLSLMLQDLQSWDVFLVAQTWSHFDLRSPRGKLIASLMAAWADLKGISYASGCAPRSLRLANAACSAGVLARVSRRIDSRPKC
jgi:hypothetical protein